jgi:hypothetical protein
VELLEETKEEKKRTNNKEWIILKHITSVYKTQWNALKTVEQYRVGGKDKEE